MQHRHAVRRFSQCVACSPATVNAYRRSGSAFIRECVESPTTLECTTGLDVLQASVADAELYEYSDKGSSISRDSSVEVL